MVWSGGRVGGLVLAGGFVHLVGGGGILCASAAVLGTPRRSPLGRSSRTPVPDFWQRNCGRPPNRPKKRIRQNARVGDRKRRCLLSAAASDVPPVCKYRRSGDSPALPFPGGAAANIAQCDRLDSGWTGRRGGLRAGEGVDRGARKGGRWGGGSWSGWGCKWVGRAGEFCRVGVLP